MLKSPAYSTPKGDLQIVSLPNNDQTLSEVLQFLINTYKKEWPLIYLQPEVPRDVDKLLETRIRHNLENGSEVSFGAREVATGKLVGALLSTVCRKATYSKESEEGYSDGIKYIIRFQQHVEGDVFTDLNTDAVVKMGVGAVDPAYAKVGLMRKIGDYFFEAAESTGIEYAISMSTSAYSSRLREKADLLLREVEYAQYRDAQTGIKPFTKPFPPHTHARECYRRFRKPKL